MVRHEAGEALGNFPPTEAILALLKNYISCNIEEVRDTCILAVHKQETFESNKQKYGQQFAGTKEPAAPFNEANVLAIL